MREPAAAMVAIRMSDTPRRGSRMSGAACKPARTALLPDDMPAHRGRPPGDAARRARTARVSLQSCCPTGLAARALPLDGWHRIRAGMQRIRARHDILPAKTPTGGPSLEA